ncbi:hypothetical protein IAU60_005628 [Kwoniella sp. DSM 27419]
MPRRKPASAKHKRQKLIDKRALKRGDVTAEEHAQSLHQLNKTYGRVWVRDSKSGGPSPDARKLQSRFVALSPTYLARTRDRAFAKLLPRPLPEDHSVFPLDLLTERDTEGKLTCPSRPKFKYGQTKKEVERNEEGHFKKWLTSIENVMQAWVDEGDAEVEGQDEDDRPPRGPTWFETNLEVWRQLWRVTETSSILLLLLDSRCPPLHCPPSLRTYLQNLNPRKEIILVLTKSDLVDPAALDGWREWIHYWWGQEGVQVVSVRSYDVDLLNDGKGKHRPDIPQDSLEHLVIALKTAHDRLLQPPAWAANNPDKLAEWTPPVRPIIDWAALARDPFAPSSSDAGKLEVSNRDNERESVASAAEHAAEDDKAVSADGETHAPRDPLREPLTIGLIGQPNVGKSSLLNALLGEQRVKAGRTPGKTKHFQTMFWGDKKEIRVVDCPGLVCPSLVGLEIQALAATIPISQIASMPSCISFAANHLPLETIFNVPYSVTDTDTDPYAGKRTYRDPALAEAERLKREEEAKREKWTAGKIMEGRAIDRGYMTAQGGRPDTNRAANGIMRNLADGRVRWGFYPPGMSGAAGRGIWLESASQALLDQDADHDGAGSDAGDQTDEREIIGEDWESPSDTEEDPTSVAGSATDEAQDEEEGEDDDDSPETQPVRAARGFFAALEIESEEDEEEEDEEEADDSN